MDDTDDLIAGLRTVIAMIMEDTSPIALLSGDRPLGEQLSSLEQAGHDIAILAQAAAVLVRRSNAASPNGGSDPSGN